MIQRSVAQLGRAFIIFLIVFAVVVTSDRRPAAADYPLITTSELKAMMEQKTPFALVDARTEEEFSEAHIVGSINIPEKKFDEQRSLLPENKENPLVFYCNGVKCGKSKRTAVKAAALGYKNIRIYSEGFPVWEEMNLPIVAGPDYDKKIETTKLSPTALKALMEGNKDGYVLVDVRDAAEYKEGHIPTALNIPAETFATSQDILPKEKKIIVYCNTGSRSYLAYRKLIKMDYKNIYQSLFADWKDAGMPVER